MNKRTYFVTRHLGAIEHEVKRIGETSHQFRQYNSLSHFGASL